MMNQSSILAFEDRPLELLRALSLSIVLLLTAPNIVQASADLTEMSLEDLMNVEVTSVSKKAQVKTSTAAAITVITSEDIRRGGFTVIPEALRMVPGLQIARVDAHRWAISVRGGTGLFANKLLVLIDGRTVYTPVFGGTYWDIQDYPIEDVDRIEVIRGPGGAIWGANAVNGVINIITKNAADTQGVLASAYGGSHEYGITARYGGAIADSTHYRGYVRGFGTKDYDIDKAYDGNDEWRQFRTGIRVDSEVTEVDTLRVSADFYLQDNEEGGFNPAFVPTFLDINYKQKGGNVLVNWDRKLGDESSLQAKAYYSGDSREFFVREIRHNAEIEFQHNFSVHPEIEAPVLNELEGIAVTWGGNYRYSTNHQKLGSAGLPLAFDPNDEQVHIASGYLQIQASFFDEMLTLIGGSKLGYYSWSGFEYQPSGRIVIAPIDGHVVWGAVSRAVRTPTQAERDLSFSLPTGAVLTGTHNARSENLLAFELGYRFFAFDQFNFEISAFWNEYENISSFEARTPPVLEFANGNELTVRGVEVEANVLPAPWWRLKIAYSYSHIDEDNAPTSISLGSPKDQNPRHRLSLQSFFELPMDFEFDVSVYYVDGKPGTTPTAQTDNVEQYVRLDLRLGYQPTEWLELSLVGQNLTDRRHYEGNDFTLGRSTQVPRSGHLKATFNF